MIDGDTIGNVLSNFGFPIFVCLWFMFRTEKVINKLTTAIEKLTEKVMN